MDLKFFSNLRLIMNCVTCAKMFAQTQNCFQTRAVDFALTSYCTEIWRSDQEPTGESKLIAHHHS